MLVTILGNNEFSFNLKPLFALEIFGDFPSEHMTGTG